MISTDSIILNTENGRWEIVISPIMLHSKERPDVKPGKIVKLFFYENWIDEEYKENLSKQEYLLLMLKERNYLFNLGQDFSKFYLGSLNVDLEQQTYWDWIGEKDKLNNEDIDALGKSLFNPDTERKKVVIFTPTPASAFQLTKIKNLDFPN